MTRTSILPALLAAGALALAGCGGSDDAPGGAGAPGNATDRAFVAEMIPHHQSALDMAKVGLERAESPFVKKLAGDIMRTQSEEIATLRREDEQLAKAGIKKGKLGVPMDMMGMGMDTKKLATATPFDRPFIEMMVPHHKGAIEMAEVELAKGSDPELKALAQEIIDAQRREIGAMGAHLAGA